MNGQVHSRRATDRRESHGSVDIGTGRTDRGPGRRRAGAVGTETGSPDGRIGRAPDLRAIPGSMTGPVHPRAMRGNGNGREEGKAYRLSGSRVLLSAALLYG